MSALDPYQRALRLLAMRAHSRAELVKKLRDRGVGRQEAQAAADRAEANGYINDADYARAYSRQARLRGLAPSRIKRELKKRGVDAQLTEAAIQDVFAEVDLGEEAALLAQKRALRLSGDVTSKRRRLAAFLSRRGFPASVVLHAVDRVAPYT